jgi:hypothetical protein
MADVHSIFKVSAVHIINKRTTYTTTFTKLRSSYISKFKKEGLLVQGKAEDELVVNKILIPEIIKDRVQITLILRVNE